MTAWVIATIFKSDDGQPSYWTGGNIWMGQLDSIGLLGPVRTWPTKQEAVAGFRKAFGRMPRKCQAVQLTEEQAALVRATDAEVDAEMVPDKGAPGWRRAMDPIISARKVSSERADTIPLTPEPTRPEEASCMSGSIDRTDLDADEARALTDQIRADAESLCELIGRAWKGRAWVALGYRSWDVYIIKEFGSLRLRLPREERPEMVASLRQWNLSIRAIESATGISHTTIQKDLASTQVCQSGTPDPVDEDALADELIKAGPATVTSISDKRHPARKPAPKPGRTPAQGSGGTVTAFRVCKQEPTPTQRRSDNEITFILQLRRARGDLDALMGFAKALDPDAKRRVIDKHNVDLADCATKLMAINLELSASEPEQELATDHKPTDTS